MQEIDDELSKFSIQTAKSILQTNDKSLLDTLKSKKEYLLNEKNIKPWNILAITFTNKAANEMKSRVEMLVGEAAKDMWIGTFHSICVKILRNFISIYLFF